jgi:hypothetical protein
MSRCVHPYLTVQKQVQGVANSAKLVLFTNVVQASWLGQLKSRLSNFHLSSTCPLKCSQLVVVQLKSRFKLGDIITPQHYIL